jgi:serine/threonine kinase PknH
MGGGSHTGPAFRGPAFEPLGTGDPAVIRGHRITARLGDGALGRVYYAHAPGGQPVALTVVRPELAGRPGFAARFHRDAQAAGRVRSRWTVPVTGSGKEGTRFWIAGAYLPAVSLHAAVSGAGPLPTAAVLRMVAGIACALRDLHHAGVVHGDLRPAQVLLTADGPRVKGYGIAREPESAAPVVPVVPVAPAQGGPLAGTPAGMPAAMPAGTPGETRADGTRAGTPGETAGGTAAGGGSPVFLSPEQAAGRPAVPATDVFALGQLAAYAAIGAAPFGDGPARTVLSRVRQEEPDLSELPGELREIVTRCLIKEPALRPSPAQVVAMCGQASPESTRPLTGPWLPPALLAALVPAMPPPAPPSPAPASPALPPPAPPSAAPPLPASSSPAPPPPAVPPPAVPPSAVPPPPGSPWHPQTWPRPAHPHFPLPRPPKARRNAGAFAAVAGLAAAVTAGVALAGGFGTDHRAADGPAGALPSAARETAAPDGSPGGVAPGRTAPGASTPAGTVPPDLGRSGAGQGAPGQGQGQRQGQDQSQGQGQGQGGGATGAPQPEATGTDYLGVQVPAGSSLSLRQDPLEVLPGALAGAFGYTAQADGFAADPGRSSLSLLDPGSPGTLDACRAAGPRVSGVPRRLVSGGTRMCVLSADGTTALVTFRRLTPPGAPDPNATVDLRVWRVADRASSGDR